MNKTNIALAVAFCLVALFGCRTREITPETSWSDYGQYYSPTGNTAAPADAPAEIRILKAAQAQSDVEALQSKDYVLLGTFVIADDTEITYNAVAALAQKLNAALTIWSTENVVAADSKLSNPAAGEIVGADNVQMARMNADRADVSFAEQVITHRHTIWMMGKKK